MWGDHFWSPSYFVTSTGGAPLERVAAYVRDQCEPSRAPGKPKRSMRGLRPHGRGLRSEPGQRLRQRSLLGCGRGGVIASS
ncbi:transposase [Rhodococcus qingshengii]|uniref:transposase n=1 Tax=Rhodococcus qingshengii TaxID=334542 RepID=UPI0036DB0F25